MIDKPERRKFVRLNLSADILYSKPDTKEKIIPVFAKNIASGGMCLVAFEPIAKGEILNLSIAIPQKKEPITVQGKVVWQSEFIVGDRASSKSYDTGVEFTNINADDFKVIQKYVADEIER